MRINPVGCKSFILTYPKAGSPLKDTNTPRYDHLSPEEMLLGLHVAKVGLGSVDYVNDTLKLDRLAAHLFDLPVSVDIPREQLHNRIHPDDRNMIERMVTELLDPMDVNTFDTTHRVVRPCDGSVFWLRVRKKIWFKGEGARAEPEKGLFAVVDITAEKRAQALSETLIKELSHRGRNVITVISGIARQLHKHSAPEEFFDKLMSRLGALSRNMYMIDAQGRSRVDLCDVFTQQIEPFADHSERISLNGPAVHVHREAGQVLAMVAHELLTNAVKYGALSNAAGRVVVHWDVEPEETGDLHLVWTEQEGPTVVPPTREGYGSQVVGTLARMSLQAKTETIYAPEGLTARFTIPKREILGPQST